MKFKILHKLFVWYINIHAHRKLPFRKWRHENIRTYSPLTRKFKPDLQKYSNSQPPYGKENYNIKFLKRYLVLVHAKVFLWFFWRKGHRHFKQLPHGFRLICELLLRKCISCHTSLFVCVIHFNEEFCTSGSSYHFMYTALKLFAAVFSVFAISKYISKEDYECLWTKLATNRNPDLKHY